MIDLMARTRLSQILSPVGGGGFSGGHRPSPNMKALIRALPFLLSLFPQIRQIGRKLYKGIFVLNFKVITRKKAYFYQKTAKF